jgi:hypothetical protein
LLAAPAFRISRRCWPAVMPVTSRAVLARQRLDLSGCLDGRRRGVVFAMARVKQDLRDDLEAAGLVAKVGEDRIFPPCRRQSRPMPAGTPTGTVNRGRGSGRNDSATP